MKHVFVIAIQKIKNNLILKGETKIVKFDAVTPSWAAPDVTAIQIRRHLTTHTIASD